MPKDGEKGRSTDLIINYPLIQTVHYFSIIMIISIWIPTHRPSLLI